MMSRERVEAELNKIRAERQQEATYGRQQNSSSTPTITRSEMEERIRRIREERSRQEMLYLRAAQQGNSGTRFGVIHEQPMDRDEMNDRIFQYQMRKPNP